MSKDIDRIQFSPGLGSGTVVFALFVLSVITYVDRASISTAKDAIAAQMGFSDTQMGTVFGAFALGYAVMQLPSGWLADKFGAKITLATTVGLWSILTALTGAAWGFRSMVTIRFLFGAGEAAVFPGSARAIRNWVAPAQRGRANGLMFAGSRLGAAMSFPLIALMLRIWSWRLSFQFLGLAGLIWTLVWLLWFRDTPASTGIELDKGPPAALSVEACGRWMTAPLGLAMVQYFASNVTTFICLSWMLPYLKSEYHLTTYHAALYSMAPLAVGASAQWVAGSVIDRLYRSPLRARSRQVPAMTGFALAALGLAAVTQAHTVGLAVIAFSVAIFGADMTVSPSWVFCSDASAKRTGTVSGVMNMCGSIGALLSSHAFPLLQKRTGSSSAYFVLAALLDCIGILCWLGMRLRASHPPSNNVLVPEPL